VFRNYFLPTSTTPIKEKGVYSSWVRQSLFFDSRSIVREHGARNQVAWWQKPAKRLDPQHGDHHHLGVAIRGREPNHGSVSACFTSTRQQEGRCSALPGHGCEESGIFQITSEGSISPRHHRNSRCRERFWANGVRDGRRRKAHGVLEWVYIGGDQSWQPGTGTRLKDGDTAVSSLFASQEGNREMKVYRSHSLPSRDVPNRKWRSSNIQTSNIILSSLPSFHRRNQAFASFLKNTSTNSIFLFSC
jgi:hypothetical protein